MKIAITETYAYEIEVNAKTKSEAIAEAKKVYDDAVFSTEGYTFTADANSHVKTTFKVV